LPACARAQGSSRTLLGLRRCPPLARRAHARGTCRTWLGRPRRYDPEKPRPCIRGARSVRARGPCGASKKQTSTRVARAEKTAIFAPVASGVAPRAYALPSLMRMELLPDILTPARNSGFWGVLRCRMAQTRPAGVDVKLPFAISTERMKPWGLSIYPGPDADLSKVTPG